MVSESLQNRPGSRRLYLRIQEAQNCGLNFSVPQCSLSRWWVKVSDYQYALCHSLKGPLATHCGIISDADYSVVQISPEREGVVVVVDSDRILEAINNERTHSCKYIRAEIHVTKQRWITILCQAIYHTFGIY